jgi:outer membrane lipoprotein-sorting protein
MKHFFALTIILALLFSLACNKDDEQNPADYVKDLEQDTNVVGFWMGYVDAKFETIQGEFKVIVSDTSTIFPALSEYQSDGADFSYALKKENGHFIHSYDPASQNSLDYWYSGPSSSTERIVYDVYSIDGKNISTRIDFDYMVYNIDTLVINDRNTGVKRLLVRVADPSKIPSTLKIKE